jgi:hypothetical protein
VSSHAQESCSISSPDPNGYLALICSYIVSNNINVHPGKPDQYKIRKITEITHDGGPVLLIELDCCFLGDIAIIDPKQNKVLKFDLGDK